MHETERASERASGWFDIKLAPCAAAAVTERDRGIVNHSHV